MNLKNKNIGDATKVFTDLNVKFNKNLKLSLVKDVEKISQAELKARAFAIIGQILRERPNLSQSQKELVDIFDELFADSIISLYLAGCSLDKPAQTLMRRVLELGIAVMYLWDMPHQFWAWKCHDKDLNFNEMIDCLNSSGYKSFVLTENPHFSGESLFDINEAKKIYRKLSNTIHGKISTFESVLPDRFSHNDSDWQEHIKLVTQVQDILLKLWKNRFNDIFIELEKRLPAITRILED